jgi:hypothetical protein
MVGMMVSGYNTSGSWQPVNAVNIRSGYVNYSISQDNSITLYLPLIYISGGNNSIYPTGFGAGYLVSVTLMYY